MLYFRILLDIAGYGSSSILSTEKRFLEPSMIFCITSSATLTSSSAPLIYRSKKLSYVVVLFFKCNLFYNCAICFHFFHLHKNIFVKQINLIIVKYSKYASISSLRGLFAWQIFRLRLSRVYIFS